MNELRCCSNSPKYKICYELGNCFLVCNKCFEHIHCWNVGIVSKTLLTSGCDDAE